MRAHDGAVQRGCQEGWEERPRWRSAGPGFGLAVRAGLWAGLLAGCDDAALTPVAVALDAEPAVLDFGSVAPAEEAVRSVRLRNVGTVGAWVTASIEPGPFAPAGEPVDLGPGVSVDWPVRYRPSRPGAEDQGALWFEADDGHRLEVPVFGSGGEGALEVRPQRVDFGVVSEGSRARREVEVRNLRGRSVSLSDLVFTSTSVDLMFAAPIDPIVVPSGQSLLLPFSYAPEDLGPDRGLLSVRTDDADRPRIEIEVVGRANLRPRAQLVGCRAQPGRTGCEDGGPEVGAGPGQVVALDARGSFDPEGAPLAFSWSVLERPEGSRAEVAPEPGAADQAELVVDRTGRFRVQLVARDERGLESEPAELLIVPRDIELVLTWDLGTDVDLHFVRPGGEVGDYGSGAPGRSLGSDCSPFNRAPNWGDLGTDLDDPRLDRDAVTQPGPEVATLDRPEPGAYLVYAHYCDSRDVRLPTAVRLSLRSRGLLVAELGPTELRPGELWAAAELRWTGASFEVTPMSTPVAFRPEVCRR